MKCAVSGATGYIGFRLAKRLLEDGRTVLGIVRKPDDRIKGLMEKYPERFFVCELSADDLFLSMRNFDPDVVFSTTCCYETDVKFLEKTVESNYIFPARLMKAAVQGTVDKAVRFISVGTSLPAELNLYSLTKKQFAELGKFYSGLGRIQFVNVLLESFYAKDEPETRFIPRSIRRLLAGQDIDATHGLQRRDYVAVQDVMDALCFLAGADTLKDRYADIPLGSGEAPQIREILEWLKVAANSNSRINFGAVPSRANEPSTKADLEPLRKLGYEKQMLSWKEGMKKMTEDIKNENFD